MFQAEKREVQNHNDDEADIIAFDDDDNNFANENPSSNFNKYADDMDENRIQYEPGMDNTNQFQADLPKLERVKTAAKQYEVKQNEILEQERLKQKQQQQQQQQQQIKLQQNDFQRANSNSSRSDSDRCEQEEKLHQSIIGFDDIQSQAGEMPVDVDQEGLPQFQQRRTVQFDTQNQDQANQNINGQESNNANSSTNAHVNPFPPKMEVDIIKELLEKDRREFLTSPLMIGKTLQVYIRRDKSGFARIYPIYHVFTTDGNIYLFSAKKVVMNTTSNYVISMSKTEFSTRKDTFLGKVRSNFLGTEFQLFDNGINVKKTKDTTRIRAQLGVVYYESHIMQNKGPRKMKILLPKVGQLNIPKVFQPLTDKEGMQFDYAKDKKEFIDEYINKPPRWDTKTKAHVLNFYGRVDQPSVKNFQLVNPEDYNYIYLQFGRVDDLTFNLDFCWPISPLQALEICVTSFDFKFACE